MLNAVVEYLLTNGLTGLSLRPLAAGINTSPRMLLYFFGSKEKLISEAMAEIRTRQRVELAWAIGGSVGREERLARLWSAWTSPQTERFWRFWMGVYAAALQDPDRYKEFRERFTAEWLGPFTQGFSAAGVPSARASRLATLSLAAMRGMQLDLLATGARSRIDGAFREMLQLLATAIRESRAERGSGRKAGTSPVGGRAPLGDNGGAQAPEPLRRSNRSVAMDGREVGG